MILDRLILVNFGAYATRQEVVLTPEEGKPVILLGGMNGGGKTTFLDSIQLGFYGRKAKTSNRGSMGYSNYLAECIHRGTDDQAEASITINYHRIVQGKITYYELQRSWRREAKDIKETLQISKDGIPDKLLTDHWEESLEAYLPVGIAHLFFFDGEQIKELAEGQNAARIIGSAIYSLLGLDLVDRLDSDLRVFERRKKADTLDPEALLRLKQATDELDHLNNEERQIFQEEGQMVNEVGQLEADIVKAKATFEAEGGALFLRQEELEQDLERAQVERQARQDELRGLVAGALPLLLGQDLLDDIQDRAHHETSIRHNRLLVEALVERDETMLSILGHENLPDNAIEQISSELKKDREQRRKEAGEELFLDADPGFETELMHLRMNTLPAAEQRTCELLEHIANLSERIAQLEADFDRIPDHDRIAAAQNKLRGKQAEHKSALHKLTELRLRKTALQAQTKRAKQQLERVDSQEVEARFTEDGRLRMLKHSVKVRKTLDEFKIRIVRKHTSRIESLMLESFHSLLRKNDLVSRLTIDPTNFSVTLLDRANNPLPFDRLSAGERQLLATSLLWGLARASGRPVPTIIDTPLGRLDSSHRSHLTERYFPKASHQVLLLSTDEEIVGDYHQTLKPFITRSYLLSHDEKDGFTSINPGYFSNYETSR